MESPWSGCDGNGGQVWESRRLMWTGAGINPFVPSGLFYRNKSISEWKDVWLDLLLPSFIEIPVLNANSVDPDQTPRSAVSDLDLHCLQRCHSWDARHRWVKWIFWETVPCDISSHRRLESEQQVDWCIRTVFSESSLVALWTVTDQTTYTRKLILVMS